MDPGLPERYAIIRKIASGGMAEVYLCRLRAEEGFEKKVAVKVVHPRLAESDRFRDMFIREARIAASLSHQNLVQVFDFGRRGTSYYLAMEFVEGWNLAQVFAQMRAGSMPIPLPLWRYWVEGMLDGISYLHSRKIIHRDITPSNILLSRVGAVKITDFGIARGVRLGEGRSDAWEGKFSYMSPEQARGEEASVSSDLFSAGVIAAEFFLPGRLFDGEGREEILARLRDHDETGLPVDRFPSDVSGILRKCLAKEREDRYPSAGSFSMAIHRAVPGTVSRTDLVAYWDLLFPGAEKGEEETVVADAFLPADVSNMVREKREAYGLLGRRGVRIGVTSAIVAVSVGGVMVWKGTGPETRQPSSVVARGSPRGSRAVPSGGIRRIRRRLPTLPTRDPLGEPSREGISQDGLSRPGSDSCGSRRNRRVSVTWRTGLLSDPRRCGWTLRPDGRDHRFPKEGMPRGPFRPVRWPTFPFPDRAGTPDGDAGSGSGDSLGERIRREPVSGGHPDSPLELPEGEHRLRFVNEPLGVERVVTVTVAPGANPKLIVPLAGDR